MIYPLWMSSCLLLVSIALSFVTEDKPVTVELGGFRQASATIKAVKHDYVVQVRFLPVRCFDEATNAALNREKGRTYGLQALTKHLSGKDRATLTVSGVAIGAVAVDGNFHTLTLRLPRKGVTLVVEDKEQRKPPVGTPKEELVEFSSALFTRKREYHQTLVQLEQQFKSGVQSLPTDGRAFDLAVAEREEGTAKNLDVLAREVAEDKLLLAIEKDELLDEIQRTQKTALDRLMEAVKEFQAKSSEKSR